MEHKATISCPRCGHTDLMKNGRSKVGSQRYHCKSCDKSFLLDYKYKAWKPGVKEEIWTQTFNGGGVRATARCLGINKNTVIEELKKKKPIEVNPYVIDNEEFNSFKDLEVDIVAYESEADEFWSFVGNKKNQRWTWYAIERKTGIILAYQNGRRTDESCQLLMKKLAHLPIAKFHTDNWGSYAKFISEEKHRIGKDNTWKIERKNLNFRIHIKRLERRTICYSRNEQIHDNVIGLYINKFYFKQGKGQFK